MTQEIMFVLVMLLITVLLLLTEKLRVDVVAMLIMVALVMFGLLSPSEGVAGFSNQATLTVGAMFILSEGLRRTGAINVLGRRLVQVTGPSEQRLTLGTMGLVATMSAFINNTAAVAVFLPLTMSVARRLKMSPSRLLMPLSFAAMFGGMATLIGTSTNVLVSAIAEEHGLGAFSMFEFFPLGMLLIFAGILYMITIGRHLIPKRQAPGGLVAPYELREYLTEVVLLPDSPWVGQTIQQAGRDLEFEMAGVIRKGRKIPLPTVTRSLLAGDVLIVSVNVPTLLNLRRKKGWKLISESALGDLPPSGQKYLLAEAIVAPYSPLVGQTLRTIKFRQRYRAIVLGMQHHQRVLHGNLANLPIEAGDLLLLYGERNDINELHRSKDFLLLQDLPDMQWRSEKTFLALGIVAGVVLVSALEWLPIMMAALLGCLLMVLTGVLELEEAYKALDAQVLIMLAGLLSLGLAMQNSGTAAYVADLIVTLVGPYGPVALLAAFYLMTTLLTSVMSNNATAALLAPIAISIAAGLGVSPKPFLVAVALAASTCFITPIGYQTNTMIYTPGGYRFSDFTLVGLPLTVLFLLIATRLIPFFWPF
ncbi:MAG: sodium:proton antiporter [Ardenticatenaceae bacterium]